MWPGREVVELKTTVPTANDQYFTLNWVNHPPVLTVTPSGNQTATSGNPLSLSVSATDPDNDTVTFSTIAGNEGYVLNQTLGLRLQGSLYLNFGGQQEKWLQSTLNNWYFIEPDGSLWKWDGTPNKATGTQVATLDPIFYYHPEMLYQGRTGDLANVMTQELKWAPTSPTYSLNYGGQNEKWLLGNDGWYFIKPNGQVWKWDGTPNQAIGVLVATLATDYYTNITRLYTIQNNQVTANLTGNTLTLTPAANYIGKYWIAVQANDGTNTVTNMFQLNVT